MKSVLFFVISASFLLGACGNKDEHTVTTMQPNGSITETALPRGKFIVDDETIAGTMPPDPTALNGYNGQDTVSNIRAIKTDPNSNLKQRYKELLVFHVDDTMKIKHSYTAKLILGKDQILGSLKAEIDESSNGTANNIKYDSTIEIGTKMKVKLKEANAVVSTKGFDIEFLGEEGALEQSITEKRKIAYWEWKITPLLPGQHALKFSISIIEKEGNPVSLPTKDIDVVIFAEKESFIESVGSFFKNESTKWVLTAILIPIFLAWITTKIRYRSDSRSRSAKSNPPPGNPAPTPLQAANNTTQQTLDGSE